MKEVENQFIQINEYTPYRVTQKHQGRRIIHYPFRPDISGKTATNCPKTLTISIKIPSPDLVIRSLDAVFQCAVQVESKHAEITDNLFFETLNFAICNNPERIFYSISVVLNGRQFDARPSEFSDILEACFINRVASYEPNSESFAFAAATRPSVQTDLSIVENKGFSARRRKFLGAVKKGTVDSRKISFELVVPVAVGPFITRVLKEERKISNVPFVRDMLITLRLRDSFEKYLFDSSNKYESEYLKLITSSPSNVVVSHGNVVWDRTHKPFIFADNIALSFERNGYISVDLLKMPSFDNSRYLINAGLRFEKYSSTSVDLQTVIAEGSVKQIINGIRLNKCPSYIIIYADIGWSDIAQEKYGNVLKFLKVQNIQIRVDRKEFTFPINCSERDLYNITQQNTSRNLSFDEYSNHLPLVVLKCEDLEGILPESEKRLTTVSIAAEVSPTQKAKQYFFDTSVRSTVQRTYDPMHFNSHKQAIAPQYVSGNPDRVVHSQMSSIFFTGALELPELAAEVVSHAKFKDTYTPLIVDSAFTLTLDAKYRHPHNTLAIALGTRTEITTAVDDQATSTAIILNDAARYSVGDKITFEGSEEIMDITGKNGNTLDVTRGYGGTTLSAVDQNTPLKKEPVVLNAAPKHIVGDLIYFVGKNEKMKINAINGVTLTVQRAQDSAAEAVASGTQLHSGYDLNLRNTKEQLALFLEDVHHGSGTITLKPAGDKQAAFAQFFLAVQARIARVMISIVAIMHGGTKAGRTHASLQKVENKHEYLIKLPTTGMQNAFETGFTVDATISNLHDYINSIQCSLLPTMEPIRESDRELSFVLAHGLQNELIQVGQSTTFNIVPYTAQGAESEKKIMGTHMTRLQDVISYNDMFLITLQDTKNFQLTTTGMNPVRLDFHKLENI